MATYSWKEKCPNCGNTEDCQGWTTTEPFEKSGIMCDACGLRFGPQVTYLTLEELNEVRDEPLDELPKQTFKI
jgi:transcription elongation factor Elf1